MRARLGWIAAACLAVAAVAWGQGVNQSNPGLTAGPRRGTIDTDVSHQSYVSRFTFQNVVSNTSVTGWDVSQTTTNGVTLAQAGESVSLTMPTTDRRVMMMETAPGFPALGSKVLNGGEVRILMELSDVQSCETSAAVLQFACGDTASYQRTKKPNAFGIIFAGSSASGLPADLPTDQYVAYVGTGTDTTYVPMGPSTVADKIFIHAWPNFGPVDFFLNDVLVASIASPQRISLAGSSLEINCSGDTGLGPAIRVGPVEVERPW